MSRGSTGAVVPTLTIAPGVELPQLGVGTGRHDDATARASVRDALALGYRSVDTAAKYENELGVGQALADVGLPRSEVFVTTKVRGADQGYEKTRAGLAASLERLGLDHVDLYLIHWPMPRLGLFVDTYRAMVEAQAEGLTRAVGVSNFLPEHLDALAAAGLPTPAVNQVEFHPYLQQRDVLAENSARGIVTEAWSPLGAGSGLLSEDVVTTIAARLGVSAAQVVLRWGVQQGVVVIPRSSNAERLAANLDVFSFALTDDDVTAVSALEKGLRTSDQHPATNEEF